MIDGAAWAAQRLDVPLEFLHVLERQPERAAMADYSGAIGLGAQDSLLQELSELDEQRSKLAPEVERRLLAAARERAAGAGLTRLDGRMRHGDLATTALELEPDARLFILGEHHRISKSARIYLDHHVEQLVRSVQRPMLVVPGHSFAAPQRVVLAFDGSPTARKTVARVTASQSAAHRIADAGGHGGGPTFLRHEGTLTKHSNCSQRVDSTSLPNCWMANQRRFCPCWSTRKETLLVVGAYGHSRIRQFIVGSTTTTLLRASEVPVLILR
ncbi:universal stress protein [Variovorax sp. LjRoot175]|uniref:universal stress protein n=1 Tax=Variovorax sp. LjRoot175 TaxID=3342276 RepID=UPI003ED11232